MRARSKSSEESMKIETIGGRSVDVRMERVEFCTWWLRVDQKLIGFSAGQLRDAELALARIEIIAHVEFDVPDDVDQWWRGVLATLDAEYKASIVEARKPGTLVRAAGAGGK